MQQCDDVDAADGLARLHSAASAGALAEVLKLLQDGVPAHAQETVNGASALMLAAGAGHGEVVEALLEAGAPWNAIDRAGRCAGNYALDAGHQIIVDALVDAGVRAELMLAAVDRGTQRATAAAAAESEEYLSRASPPRAQLARKPQRSPRGLRPWLVRGGNRLTAARAPSQSLAARAPPVHYPSAYPPTRSPPLPASTRPPAPPHPLCSALLRLARLAGGVRYEGDTLFDAGDDAVMMAWEAPLMEEHARRLCEHARALDGSGGAVLNVGFGMGIIDGAIAQRRPRLHVIIEAHAGVLERMRADGWHSRDGVRVCEGRWQDVLPMLLQEGVAFEGVFYDTYGEHDTDMADFHAHLPRLLAPGGLYSFFNGLCPFNVFFQGVACSVVQLELQVCARAYIQRGYGVQGGVSLCRRPA